MCWSMVTLRRPSSHCTVKLSWPPPFSHCLILRSSAQEGLTAREFTAASTSAAQTQSRHTHTHTYSLICSIQHVLHVLMETFCSPFTFIDTEDEVKWTKVGWKKINQKWSIHSHCDGNKRHTGILTCPAPSQLDHKAIGQVSLSVWCHLGVTGFICPGQKVRDGGQVRVQCVGQSQGRLRRVGWGHTVGGLWTDTEDRYIYTY